MFCCLSSRYSGLVCYFNYKNTKTRTSTIIILDQIMGVRNKYLFYEVDSGNIITPCIKVDYIIRLVYYIIL